MENGCSWKRRAIQTDVEDVGLRSCFTRQLCGRTSCVGSRRLRLLALIREAGGRPSTLRLACRIVGLGVPPQAPGISVT